MDHLLHTNVKEHLKLNNVTSLCSLKMLVNTLHVGVCHA